MAEERGEMERLPDPHGHPPPDDDTPPGRHELLAYAMKELLVEKGVLTNDDVRSQLETIDSWQSSKGAEIVARAWTDADFKKLLLTDAADAVRDFNIDVGEVRLTRSEEHTSQLQSRAYIVFRLLL